MTGRIQLVTARSGEKEIPVNIVVDGKMLTFIMSRRVAASTIARLAAALSENSS